MGIPKIDKNILFINIMKNIFLYNKTSAQNDLELNNLTINQSLKLNGADPNELLITDSNSNVVGFNNGPDRYLLEIDSTTHTPAWTNNISVDEITTNTVTINGTQQADLLTVQNSSGNLIRLPVGLNYQVLSSYVAPSDPPGSFPLKYKYISELLNLGTGSVFVDQVGNLFSERNSYTSTLNPITFTSSTLLLNLDFNIVAGRNYKVSVTFNNLISGGGQNTYSLVIQPFGTFETFVTSVSSSQENVLQPFNAPSNGTISVQMYGAHTGGSGGSNGTINNMIIIIEPLGYP